MHHPLTINIVCATSRAYLYPTGLMLFSLRHCLSEQYQVKAFVLCRADDEAVVERHLRVLRDDRFCINLVQIDSGLAKFRQWFGRIANPDERRSFNWLAGGKLLIPELLPKAVARVIWLDSDLVVRTDVSELWNTPMGDYAVGAIQDENIPTAGQRWGAQVLTLGIDAMENYYNSGVLLIDRQRFSTFISAALIDELLDSLPTQNAPDLFRYYDQDFINYLLRDTILALDPRWNRTKRQPIGWNDILSPASRVTNSRRIQHYPHLDKPWRWKTSTVESYYFYQAAQTAPWKNKFTRKRWLLVALCAVACSPLRKIYRWIKHR